jgi:hypothetical protein
MNPNRRRERDRLSELALILALNDKDPDVRREARRALEQLRVTPRSPRTAA